MEVEWNLLSGLCWINLLLRYEELNKVVRYKKKIKGINKTLPFSSKKCVALPIAFIQKINKTKDLVQLPHTSPIRNYLPASYFIQCWLIDHIFMLPTIYVQIVFKF